MGEGAGWAANFPLPFGSRTIFNMSPPPAVTSSIVSSATCVSTSFSPAASSAANLIGCQFRVRVIGVLFRLDAGDMDRRYLRRLFILDFAFSLMEAYVEINSTNLLGVGTKVMLSR